MKRIGIEIIFNFLPFFSDNILQIGCGNSTLAADLYDVGYR